MNLNLNLNLFTVSKAKNKFKTLDIEEVKKMFRTWNWFSLLCHSLFTLKYLCVK